MAIRGLLLPLLAVFSVALTAFYVTDIVSTKSYASSCEMTYSWPVYTPVTWRGIPSHAKYQVVRVDMKQPRDSLSGVPVLFIPGHLGSYKQARSLSRHLWDLDPSLFDVFALDFQEEPTGLNGNLITEQATFLNDAVRAILREYKRQSKKTNKQLVIPESVVIVAHSMGGVVARTAETLSNYKRRSIQHVVALGVPYGNPSFPFDAEVNAVYDRMHNKREDDVVYVAIAGGHKDTLVTASLTSVDKLLKVVAESLYKAVDLETRELMSDPSIRLAIAQEVLVGVNSEELVEINSNVSLHRTYVQDGYYPGEYVDYALLLPQYFTHLLRTKFMTLVVIMYALALQIFYAQVAQWQSRFNFQSTSSPEDLNQDDFPSFTSMMHPISHAPGFLKSGAEFVSSSLGRTRLGLSTAATVMSATLALAMAVFTGFGKSEVSSSWEVTDRLTVIAELIVLYSYALGLVYAFTKLFSLLQRFIVSPVVSVLDNVTDRLKLQRWMIIAIIHGVVQLLGYIRSSNMESSGVLASSVLAAFAVFVTYLVALGGNVSGTTDQQNMKCSLFAVLWLSIFPWVGKIAYFAGLLHLPPSGLSNDLLVEGGSYVAILTLLTYLISLSLDRMVPLPPTAFFGASSGQDAASAYGKVSNNSSVKITAENCPKCVFEDGGPGAVLVEYTNHTTRRVMVGKTGEVVYVGPTFRVVSCDCVYRFKTSRDFCDFCIRSCRLCGGGSGNFQEAAKYKDFLKDSKVELAMHALVPMIFQICAAVQVTYGLCRPHLSFYLTPVCAVALVIYHVALLHPIEARRIKNKQRKKTSKKKKSSTKSKSKAQQGPATTTAVPSTTTTTTSETTTTTSRNKKKKKRKSGTSSTALPLIEEVTPSS
ncbi:hypothetical protein BBP00_00002777 [Phytophthora kernoviae]|uniref:GPI inositol-deacylase n=1 Tax=Phytophthora kernoviae TaxID=325452 RepID=A0A3F2RWD6_9STRA|nr:hypothetical protein BBP00_00002777 [Phytophthora kernoviae]